MPLPDKGEETEKGRVRKRANGDVPEGLVKLGFSKRRISCCEYCRMERRAVHFSPFPGKSRGVLENSSLPGGTLFSVLETSMSLWKFGVLAKNLAETIFNGYQLTGNG